MRKKWLFFILIVFIGVCLTGCLTTRVDVRVNKDGSGTITQTFLMKSEFVAMLAMMSEEETFSLLDEEELQEKALNMGTGVEYLGAEEFEEAGFSGYRADYSFQDVSNIRLNQNPGEDLPEGASGDESVSEIIRFSFEEGSTNKLLIHLPEQEFKRDARPESSIPKEEQEEFMKNFSEIYSDMKIAMYISVDGKITKTNAAYTEGNTITLMEIDLSRIADDTDKLLELAGTQPETLEELKTLIADIPAMKAELQEEVEVYFR